MKNFTKNLAFSLLFFGMFAQPATAHEVSNKVYHAALHHVGLDEVNDRAYLRDLFHDTIGNPVDPYETPWCAAFVDAMLVMGGKPKLGSLWARDFLGYGTPVSRPEKGDIVVLKRGKVNGHVGFFERYHRGRDGRIWVGVLGGNNELKTGPDSSGVAFFPVDLVLGYRRF